MNSINPNMTAPVSGAAGTAAVGNMGTPASDQPLDMRARRKFQMDQRYIAPFLVTCVLLVGQLSARSFDNFYKTTALAIAASILTELILGRLFTGKTPHLASAYVSGISVGILMRSTETWPFVLCAAISIASKYVIRYKGRHLWNPSNLGIVAMLLLAPRFVSTLTIQWDNRLWAMIAIWSLGSFIIYRLKRFHICLTYALCFVGYAALRASLGHDAAPVSARFLAEVAPITGPMYQLFIFFMITDPKTNGTLQTRPDARRVPCGFNGKPAAHVRLLRFARARLVRRNHLVTRPLFRPDADGAKREPAGNSTATASGVQTKTG